METVGTHLIFMDLGTAVGKGISLSTETAAVLSSLFKRYKTIAICNVSEEDIEKWYQIQPSPGEV